MQTVVISGGTSGIGEACCIKYLDEGYRVINLDIIDSVILNKYNRYTWIKTDVAEEKNIVQSLKMIDCIDILVISAGKHLSAIITETNNEDLVSLININLLGAFWLIKHVIPYMIKQNKGNIVTIGSDQYLIAKPNSAVYGMTKAALSHLTKSTALDYAKYNIRANCVGAGTIDTPLYRNAIEKYSKKSGVSLNDIEKEEASLQPIGRVGTANEVAELVYFLNSDKSCYITGAYIPIDGGYTVR